MTDHDDAELLARFNGRLAGIEGEIGEPPAWVSRHGDGSAPSLGPGFASRRGLGATGMLVAIVVVVALLVGLPRRGAQNPSGALPSESASPTPSASPSPPMVIGANELPVSIRGEPVLTVPEALTLIEEAKPATFLVGGLINRVAADCPGLILPAPVPLNTGLCGSSPTLEAPPGAPTGQSALGVDASQVIWTIFVPGASPVDPSSSPGAGSSDLAVVLRVHSLGPTPGVCSTGPGSECELAVVVDAIEWSAVWIAPPRPPNPTPTPPLSIVCSSPLLKVSWCPAVEMKVAAAVADLGYPVQRIVIETADSACDFPWADPNSAYSCVGFPGVAAYVAFDGTNYVAAVKIGMVGGKQPTATVVSFRVPPDGWTMP